MVKSYCSQIVVLLGQTSFFLCYFIFMYLHEMPFGGAKKKKERKKIIEHEILFEPRRQNEKKIIIIISYSYPRIRDFCRLFSIKIYLIHEITFKFSSTQRL